MKNFNYDIIKVGQADVHNLIGSNIVAFQIAAAGAMGDHGGVYFVTMEKKVYYTCYLKPSEFTGFSPYMPIEDIMQIFPPLKHFKYKLAPFGWKYEYLGFGNDLLVKGDYYQAFTTEVEKLEKEYPGDILYNLWLPAIMNCLK